MIKNLSEVLGFVVGSTSILTLTKGEVYLCVVMTIVVLILFILCYNRIFAVTFDENFAKATGIKANAYNLFIAVITAMIIVLAMNLVGSLLISALIIFPALSAMRVITNFKGVVIYSAIISVCSALAGMMISILCSTPVGATIVAVHIVIFALNCVIGKVIGR